MLSAYVDVITKLGFRAIEPKGDEFKLIEGLLDLPRLPQKPVYLVVEGDSGKRDCTIVIDETGTFWILNEPAFLSPYFQTYLEFRQGLAN